MEESLVTRRVCACEKKMMHRSAHQAAGFVAGQAHLRQRRRASVGCFDTRLDARGNESFTPGALLVGEGNAHPGATAGSQARG